MTPLAVLTRTHQLRSVAAGLTAVAMLLAAGARPAASDAAVWGEPVAVPKAEGFSPVASVDRRGVARFLAGESGQILKLDRKSRVIARCPLPDLGRRSDPGLPRPFLAWDVGPDGSMLMAWYYDPRPGPRRVAAVTARPDSCFTPRQVLSDVDRSAGLSGARVGPDGTAVAFWSESAGGGRRTKFASGRAGARLAQRGIIAKSDRYGDPIATSVGFMRGDRVQFSWGKQQVVRREDPVETVTRMWSAATGPRATRLGRPMLVAGGPPGREVGDGLKGARPLTARDGTQVVIGTGASRLRVWTRKPQRTFRQITSMDAPTGEDSGRFSSSAQAIEPGGAVVHAWTAAGDVYAVVRRRDGRLTQPQALTGDTDVTDVSVAIDGEGRAVVTWAIGSEVWIAAAGRAGDFTPARLLSERGLGANGHPYVAANDRGEVAVTWASATNPDEYGNKQSHPILIVRGRLGG